MRTSSPTLVALGLLAVAGCKKTETAEEKQPIKSTPPPVVMKLDQIPRAQFNRVAAELALPIF